MNTPHYLTLGQAAKATGKSKPTISKYIANGKLSIISKSKDGYQIDPSELFRVFTPLQETNDKTLQSLTPEITPSNSALQVEVDLLRERLIDKDTVIEDLRIRLDGETEERRKLTMMVTDTRLPSDSDLTKPSNFWNRLFRVS